MMRIRKYMRHGLLGLVISAAFTMLGSLIEWHPLVITPEQIVGTFLLGIVVGELALILEAEIGSFTIRLLLHMVLTLGVVIVFDWYFKSLTFIFAHPITFVIEFLIIYLIVWATVRLSTKNDIDLINEQLANNRQKK
ncbi:DUF3021 domain-containing protein [Periweissella ghanensis]|uniref:DUF3021 domain-containing protein n=1 Tax=Periweissella ghanensis TaxID=467997 RepID=A0ABM8ZC89_9LACO|nr:DUF3021 domain-containing protein [Periweissella ghanensis]MCM0600227.1 DUF3021 domain-containing protein [Periweissella ghanensis]CAH0419141.1 hypothetical protein WGH24286_01588 [Periweissella ghanensis]